MGIDARKAKSGAREVEQSMGQVRDASHKTRDELGRFTKEARGSASALGLLRNAAISLAGGLSATLILRTIIRDTAEYENALVELGKAADVSGQELDDLGSRFTRLARNLNGSAVQLINVAAGAARLGITGTANLEKFTAAIARFQAGSLNALSPDSSATAFAQILNVTGEATDNIEELTGAVLILGDVTAATEVQVLEFGTEIARAISTFGVGSVQATALAAAVASVGGEAASASTSFFEAFNTIARSLREGGTQLELLQDIMGLTREEIQTLFAEDSVAAFARFIRGLSEIKASGQDVVPILEQLELGESRIARNLLPLIGNYRVLEQSLDAVSDSNANVQKGYDEVARSAGTLTSRYESLGDTLKEVRVQIGGELEVALKGLTTTTAQATAVLFGLDGAQEEASASSLALGKAGRALAIVLGVIAVTRAPLAIAALVTHGKALATVLVSRVNPALVGTTGLLTKLALGALAVVAAFSLGQTIYDQFRIVQEGAALAIQVMADLWARIVQGAKHTGAFLEDVANDVADALLLAVGEAIAAVGRGLLDVENLLKGTFLEMDLGGTAVRDFGQALVDQTFQGSNLAEVQRQINAEAEAAIAENQAIYDESIRMIDEEWADRGATSAATFFESFFEEFNSNVAAPFEAIMGSTADAVADHVVPPMDELTDATNEAQQALDNLATTPAVTPETVANIEGVRDRMREVTKESNAALDALQRYFVQLNLEHELIGQTSAQRERAIELSELEAKLRDQTIEDLTSIRDLLENGPIEIEIDPAKAELISDILDRVREKLEAIKDQEEFEQFAENVGDSFGNVAKDVVFAFETIEGAAEKLLRNVAELVFDQLVTRQISNFITDLLLNPGGFGSLFGGANADGNAFDAGRVIPFASGGVVSSPTMFPMAGGRAGLMGEAGPEAILPLRRGSDGALGVIAQTGGGRSVTVNMNFTGIRDYESFRYNEAAMNRRMVGIARRL